MSAAQFLRQLQEKGIAVWLDGGRLRYDAALATLTLEELLALRNHQDEICALLKHAPVPLTYSQWWSWHTLGLAASLSSRSVATAMRIPEQIDRERLHDALLALVARHEALRTRISVERGKPQQVIDKNARFQLEVLSLGSAALEPVATEWVRQPVSVSRDPLFAACLMQLEDDASVLVVAMDHIISDGASLEILIRDLWALYGGEALAPVSLQFADYAHWLQRSDRAWRDKHEAYWRERLAGATATELFRRQELEPSTRMACVPVRVSEVLSKAMRELARRHRTTLAMGVLTVYGMAVMRTCQTSDVVIPFVSTSRLHPEVKNTIGYFGAVLYLRLVLRADDTVEEAIARVTREYAAASLHADAGRLSAGLPRPAYAANPRFNWIPTRHPSAVPIVPRDDVDERGGGPELVMWDTAEGLQGEFWYRADRFAAAEVGRFVASFCQALEAIPGVGARIPTHADAISHR